MPGVAPWIIWLQIFSIFINLFIITYFFLRGRKSPLLYTYLWCQVLILIWSLGQIYEILYGKQRSGVVITIAFSAVCYIGVCWLLFCLHFTGQGLADKKNFLKALFILPVLFHLSILTNDYHHWFVTGIHDGKRVFGWLGFGHMIYQFTYILIGAYLLLRFSIEQYGKAKFQSILLVICVPLPLITNVLVISDVIKSSFDFTAIVYSFSMVLILFAASRYQFLSIVPIALREIVDNLHDAVVVIDNNRFISNYNMAFQNNFGQFLRGAGTTPVNEFIDRLAAEVDENEKTWQILIAIKQNAPCVVSGLLTLPGPEQRDFDMKIQPLFAGKELVGQVVTFHEISDTMNLLRDFNSKNRELTILNERLRVANEQLQAHTKTMEELAIIKERNRLARDVHDTLGQTMTLLLTLMEVGKLSLWVDPVEVETVLDEACRVVREGLHKIRRSLSGVHTEILNADNLVAALEQMIVEYERSGINVDLCIDKIPAGLGTQFTEAIYRICQEALTNSLRHGKSTEVNIILRFTADIMKLYIFDNGQGCKNIHPGMGLTGMGERVGMLGGHLVYGSDGMTGFNIHIEIPFLVNCV